MARFLNTSDWDAGVAFFSGTEFEMASSLAIIISASIFAYRSWDGPVFVIRINILIFFVGLSLFLLDLCNILRPYTLGLLHVFNNPFMALFAFLYYFLELSSYWLFSFKYYTAASSKIQIEVDDIEEDQNVNCLIKDK